MSSNLYRQRLQSSRALVEVVRIVLGIVDRILKGWLGLRSLRGFVGISAAIVAGVDRLEPQLGRRNGWLLQIPGDGSTRMRLLFCICVRE